MCSAITVWDVCHPAACLVELPGGMSVEFPSGMSGTGFDSMTIMSTSTLQHQLDQEESVLNKFKGDNDTVSPLCPRLP